MSLFKELLDFFNDKRKLHQILFFLPPITFYLTNKSKWLIIGNLVLLAIIEVYKADLENKVSLIISNRVKQMSKNKPLVGNWKDQLKDAGKEFNYIYGWGFFGLIGLVFIIVFIYSTIVSYSYSWILFGLHVFLIIYFIFLDLILDHNFKLLARRRKQKGKIRSRKGSRKK